MRVTTYVPCKATNYHQAPTTKFRPRQSTQRASAQCLLFVVSLLALVIVAAIAVTAVHVVVATVISLVIVIAVAALMAVTGNFL